MAGIAGRADRVSALEGYSPTRRLALATNAASTSVGVMFLTESLILAQDERWRRA